MRVKLLDFQGEGESPPSILWRGVNCELQICYIFSSIRLINYNKNVEIALTTVTLFYGNFFRAFVKNHAAAQVLLHSFVQKWPW